MKQNEVSIFHGPMGPKGNCTMERANSFDVFLER